MTADQPGSDIACILQLAFGRAVLTTPVPIPPGHSERFAACALHDPALPPRVLLARYSPQHRSRAFCALTAMQALRSRNFPVPAVYYLGWSHYTRFVLMLMEYIEGRGDEGQPAAFFARIGDHFAQTLARLHRQRWDTPPDLPVKPFHLMYNTLAGQVRALNTPVLVSILNWLDARAGRITELPYTVLHGDYTLHNVLAHGTQVVAVHGWEHAATGDPRLDIGHTSAALGAYGLAFSDQFIEAYEAAAGPVPDRAFWEVFSALRLLTGIERRLDAAPDAHQRRLIAQVGPTWEGLLTLVEHRAGLGPGSL
jgi:aminoglycoside phosphotransferase (APT) family kinase protein